MLIVFFIAGCEYSPEATIEEKQKIQSVASKCDGYIIQIRDSLKNDIKPYLSRGLPEIKIEEVHRLGKKVENNSKLLEKCLVEYIDAYAIYSHFGDKQRHYDKLFEKYNFFNNLVNFIDSNFNYDFPSIGIFYNH